MNEKKNQAKKISDNIKRLRNGLDWNQAKLAHEAGISGAALSKIEQGAKRIPTIVVLRKLSSALSVNISEITGEELEVVSEAQERNREFYRQWGDLENLSKEDQEMLKGMAARLKEIKET